MYMLKAKDSCIAKIMPYNHSLHSQWEAGFMLTLTLCLMPYIKLWWHSEWGGQADEWAQRAHPRHI